MKMLFQIRVQGEFMIKMMMMAIVMMVMRTLFQIRVQGGAETRRCSCLEERGEVSSKSSSYSKMDSGSIS